LFVYIIVPEMHDHTNIKYSEFVFIALGIQHCHLWPILLYHIFPHYLHKR